ncbi:hypothetical protein KKC60_04585 [Patescibacteria group bacterium]|nr:hypothetical protein [Patescibacteria group bacterium]
MKKLTTINLVVSCLVAQLELVVLWYFTTGKGDLIGTESDVIYYLIVFLISGLYYFVYLLFFWPYGLFSGKIEGEKLKNLLFNLFAVIVTMIGHFYFAVAIVGGIAF